MVSYYCAQCHSVWSGTRRECCGREAELFSPEKHGESLVGQSNAWIAVWSRWRSHPLLQEVLHELAENECYSAATCLNEFIQRLLTDRLDRY